MVPYIRPCGGQITLPKPKFRTIAGDNLHKCFWRFSTKTSRPLNWDFPHYLVWYFCIWPSYKKAVFQTRGLIEDLQKVHLQETKIWCDIFKKKSSKTKVPIRFLCRSLIFLLLDVHPCFNKCLTTRNSCSSSDVHPPKHPKMSPQKKGPQSKNKGDHLLQLRLLLVLGIFFPTIVAHVSSDWAPSDIPL